VFATSGRARLAYESAGVEGGADVLLIHAGVNDRRSWRHVVERLGPRHRCVAYDMRGFGETSYEREDGWSPVSDALAVVDAAGLEQPVVIACSMGGETAIDLALAHADRVAGLVLIGTAVRGAPYRDIEEGRVGGPARELFLDMNRRALRAEDPGEQAEIPPAWPRLCEISAPTLVMIGRLDAEDVQAIDEQAAGIIPGGGLRFLDGVAHLPHLEGDRATLDEIAAFVDGLA
jgi:pimeloyl-ACP methyl ester carboxylesterase